MNKENFSGYTLAGGKSSRMGADKAFLKIGDQTFLERAIKTLSEICADPVKIVLNHSQDALIEKLPADVSYITDVYENRGALGAIHASLKDCRTKYALIFAVDLPFITSESLEKLADIAESSNKFLAVVPRQTEGKVQPLCAVYHARYSLRTLENLMNENPHAAVSDFLDLISTRYVAQNKLSDDENLLFNVNHPADFEKVV
jgi:molybdopterin-guanine dinucleotide biosynthesis protein A